MINQTVSHTFSTKPVCMGNLVHVAIKRIPVKICINDWIPREHTNSTSNHTAIRKLNKMFYVEITSTCSIKLCILIIWLYKIDNFFYCFFIPVKIVWVWKNFINYLTNQFIITSTPNLWKKSLNRIKRFIKKLKFIEGILNFQDINQ